MYYFSKPTNRIVSEIKRLVGQTQYNMRAYEIVYDLYTANVAHPIGKLTVTTGLDDYDSAWLHVKAERLDDLGRNNTIGCGDLSKEGIALAIGFSCGSAFWRATPYR